MSSELKEHNRMTHDLRNRVALITGSSRGIGKGIARTFADLGADVVLDHEKPPRARKPARSYAPTLERMSFFVPEM